MDCYNKIQIVPLYINRIYDAVLYKSREKYRVL